MNSTALVIQPGLQHSHQLAWALHEHGLLQSFWSGVPVRNEHDLKPLGWSADSWQRVKLAEIPASRRKAMPWWWMTMRLATRLGSRDMRFRNMHRVLHAFDRVISRRIARARPQAVVAYENAALHTFRAARACGALCILDAASFHYDTGNQLLPSADPAFQPQIDGWKRDEIELADHIICCSELARESYIRAGVSPDRVTALALGATLPTGDFSRFAPPEAGPVRFIYAGAMHTRKSIDLIFAVFERLNAATPGRAELHIYGGSDSREWVDKARSLPNVQYHGPVSQVRLYEGLANCHCLLLPSRFDSFGMVVAEAMAVGTPAIVSEQTGSKMIIERHPGAGWIIPAQLERLESAIERLLDDRPLLQRARLAARQAASEFDWPGYRRRAAAVFTQLLTSERQRSAR